MALSDPSGKLAGPLTIIDRRDDLADIKAITSIINQCDVRRVIVGLPRSMDGSLSKQAEKVTAFTQKLCRHTKVPVEFRDERLTTVSAKRLMSYAKKARRKEKDDAVAAALILQGFLDEGSSEKLY